MKYITLSIVTLMLGGCAFGVVDHSNDAQTADIVATCFAVRKPAFLYEARCADLEAGGFGDSTFCTGIQGFDPQPYESDQPSYRYNYPRSWEEYVSARSAWDETLFHKLSFEKQRSIIAPIDVGTRMKLTGIYAYPRGETGRVLIVRAMLTSGEFKGTEVELPSRGGFADSGPAWVQQWTYQPDEEITLSSEYLEQCGSQ